MQDRPGFEQDDLPFVQEDHLFPEESDCPSFGSSAIRPLPDPWLCVPTSRRGLLFWGGGSVAEGDQIGNRGGLRATVTAPTNPSRYLRATFSAHHGEVGF